LPYTRRWPPLRGPSRSDIDGLCNHQDFSSDHRGGLLYQADSRLDGPSPLDSWECLHDALPSNGRAIIIAQVLQLNCTEASTPQTRTTSLSARGGRTWRIPPWHFVQIRQHAFQTRSSKAFRGHQSHFAAAQPPDAPSTRTATPRTRTAPQWFTNPTKILTPLVGRGTKTPMAGRNSIGRFGKFAACELELMFHSFFSRHDKHCDCVTLVRSILPLNPMVKCECAAWSSLPHHLDAAMAGNYQQGEGW
jgi:hypothetical protein